MFTCLLFSAPLFTCGSAYCTTAGEISPKVREQSPSFASINTYKTCLHPYEGSYIYAENAIISLFYEKKDVVQKFITSNYIDKQGNILNTTGDDLISILEDFWSGSNGLVVAGIKVPKLLERDFNNFMDKVFEEGYAPASSYKLNTIRKNVNLLSAIIELSHSVYGVR